MPRTDEQIEAAAMAIWKSETSRVVRDDIYHTNVIPWNAEHIPPKVWDGYRTAAREAFAAADAVAPPAPGAAEAALPASAPWRTTVLDCALACVKEWWDDTEKDRAGEPMHLAEINDLIRGIVAVCLADRQCRDERWAQLDREKKLEMLAAGGLADIARRDGKNFPAGGSR